MEIIASAPQPAGYLTIIQHDALSRRRRCACRGTRRKRLTRRLAVARRLIRQLPMEVLGLLTVAGAAKSGFGGWAAGEILTLLPI